MYENVQKKIIYSWILYQIYLLEPLCLCLMLLSVKDLCTYTCEYINYKRILQKKKFQAYILWHFLYTIHLVPLLWGVTILYFTSSKLFRKWSGYILFGWRKGSETFFFDVLCI